MAGDPFKKVATGDKVRPTAQWHNAVTDAARANLNSQKSGGQGVSTGTPGGLIYVLNNSGGDVNQFGVLGVEDVQIGPRANLKEFQNHPSLVGEVPSTPTHTGKFVITAEPIASNKIGRAFVFGATPVKVNVTDITHKYADVATLTTDHLLSGAVGGAQILSHVSATGLQWLLVRFASDEPADFIAGTFCDTASPVYTDTHGIQGISFQIDDFDFTLDSTGGVNRARVEWHGFSVFSQAYGAAEQDFCATKVLHFHNNNNPDAAPPVVSETNPTPNALKFNVKWTLDGTSLKDPCETCSQDPDVKGAATIDGDVYVDPCSMLPYAQKCDGTKSDSPINTFIFGNGLTTDFAGACVDGNSTATVSLNLSIDQGSDYLQLDTSDPCAAVLNLCTATETVVTAVACSGGVLNVTTADIIALTDCS